MKLMIASDLHGSAPCCRRLLEAFQREGAHRLLLLGDLLYHGPRNDLPEGYAPKEVISLLNGARDSLLCVRGNCDTEVDQMVLDFPILSDSCLVLWEGLTIFATHGHHFTLDNPPPYRPGDILLHGHTHVPACESRDGLLYLNPGSTTLPKQGSVRSYMTLEQGTFLWKALEDGAVYQSHTIYKE